MSPPITNKQNNFNLIRLILAALVIVSHSFELVDGNRSRELLTQLFGTLSFGELAVDCFFLVSGYLILQSWMLQPNGFEYLKKRVLRIYPAFLVCSLICLCVVVPLGSSVDNFAAINFLQYTKDALLLHPPQIPNIFSGSHYPAINGAMWTIEWEFRCYLIVLVLGLLGLLRSRLVWLGVTVLLIITYLAMQIHGLHGVIAQGPASVRPLIRLALFFFVGGCFYLYRDFISYNKKYVVISSIALITLLFVLPLSEIALAIFGGYCLFYFAFMQIKYLGLFQKIDDISYGVYLYGWPVQKLLIWFIPAISPYSVLTWSLLLCFILGWLSWKLIEKPCLNLKYIKRVQVINI